jgi:hypothetical protein
VAMAERETLVSTEMPLAKSRISSAGPNPALPTTKPSLRNKMIPRMVNTLGVKTPAKVPRVPLGAGISRWLRGGLELLVFFIYEKVFLSRKYEIFKTRNLSFHFFGQHDIAGGIRQF